ncbi:MAG: chloride channel protein [Solirubrobacteraceae bacterium]
MATCVAWLALPDHAVYSVPTLGSPSPYLIIWAVIAGVLIGVIAAGYIRLIGWASDHRPAGGRLLIEPPDRVRGSRPRFTGLPAPARQRP